MSLKRKLSSYSVGDLIKLQDHCRESGRIAMIVEVPDQSLYSCVKIMFLDNGKRVPASPANIEVISESR